MVIPRILIWLYLDIILYESMISIRPQNPKIKYNKKCDSLFSNIEQYCFGTGGFEIDSK